MVLTFLLMGPWHSGTRYFYLISNQSRVWLLRKQRMEKTSTEEETLSWKTFYPQIRIHPDLEKKKKKQH